MNISKPNSGLKIQWEHRKHLGDRISIQVFFKGYYFLMSDLNNFHLNDDNMFILFIHEFEKL